ncbi:hypothetical protein OH77DRAFT_1548212, partial [Trametes cingulata]
MTFLRALSLAGAFICVACKVVVLPSALSYHIRQHNNTRISVDINQLNKITEDEGILDEWPSIPAAPPVQYEGLVVEEGFSCPFCSCVFGAWKSLANHAREEHAQSLSERDSSIRRVHIQRFGRGVSFKTPFEVKLRALQLQSSQADYLEAMRKDLNARPSLPSSEVDHRHISPWHITTRWHLYLDNRDISEALALITIPKEDDPLFFLVACVKTYMQAIYDTIPHTSEVCRQILNTDIQTEDLNHTPFSQHQMEDTLRAYSRLVLQLLCFLLRGEADLVLPDAVSQALAGLRCSLNMEVDDATSAIHCLLLALWTQNWCSTQANPFPDPTVRFVIHTQLNRDGSLKGPKDVTGIFAKLVYNMRLVFLKECHRLSAEDPAHPSHAVAARSLRLWFTIGQESTFHSLRSLQHRASSIVVSTQNEPNMKWKDGSNFTTLIYLGHEVSL